MRTLSSTHEWFLEPHNARTNRILSENLEAEDFIDDVTCEGRRCKVWRCDHLFVGRFVDSFSSMSDIKYSIFHRNGRRGKVRKWDFEKRNKKR